MRQPTVHCIARTLGVLAVSVLTMACSSEPAADPCNPGAQISSMSRAALNAWGARFTYRPADSARGYLYGFASVDSAYVEVIDTKPDSGGFNGCLIGRLVSRRAYPSSGIGVGTNYMVADSLNAGHRLVIIPEDSTVGIGVHLLVPHQHAAGATPPPALGLRGSCSDCGSVKKPFWCRSSMDEDGMLLESLQQLGPLRPGPLDTVIR